MAPNVTPLFLFVLSLVFSWHVATRSEKYCYKDWVVWKIGKEREDNWTEEQYFKIYTTWWGKQTLQQRLSRNKEKEKFKITMALSFFG